MTAGLTPWPVEVYVANVKIDASIGMEIASAWLPARIVKRLRIPLDLSSVSESQRRASRRGRTRALAS
jgi:hypothetical protein